MINQAAKRILKALSFDGVEVDAFRHMADLKRLDPMKIFYKKIDEKIYNGSHAVPVRIFFPNEKSFQESNDKTSDSRDKKLLLFVHGGGWVTESIDNYERICARLADATGQYVAAVEYRLAPEDKFPSGLEDCYVVAKALYIAVLCIVAMNASLDYEHHAVLIGYFCYIFHERRALGIPFCYISMFKEPWALLGFGLTLTYNGERGKQNKLVNYLFYPVHLLILGIIRMYLGI